MTTFQEFDQKLRKCSAHFSFRFSVAIFVSYLFYLLSYSRFELPFFWDEVIAYWEQGLNLFNSGLTKYFDAVAPGLFHFPFNSYLIAIPLKLGAEGIFIHKLLSFLVFQIGFVLIFSEIARLGYLWAIVFSLLVISTPIVVTQMTMILPDLQMAGLALASFYFLNKRKWCGFLFFSSLLALSRYSAIGILLPFFIFGLVRDREFFKENRKQFLFTALCLILPLFIYTGFLLLIKNKFDTFLPHIAQNDVKLSLEQFRSQAERVFSTILVWNGRYLITLSLIPLLIYSYLKDLKPHKSSYFWLPILIILLFGTAFSFNSGYLNRYSIPALFALYGLFLYLVKSANVPISLVIGFLLVFGIEASKTHFQSDSSPGNGHPTSLQYRSVIEVHKNAIQFVEENYEKKEILTNWPIAANMMIPGTGYNEKRLNVHWANSYKDENIDVVIWTNNSDVSKHPTLESVIDKAGLKEIRRFEKQGKIAIVYAKPD